MTLKINLAIPNNVNGATLQKPGGQFLVNYGVTDALAPFPLRSLVTNMTCTINNNTVSMNVQDTLPVLLRLLDAEELAKYECMTPTTLDFLANYRDGIDLLEYQIDTATNAGGGNLRPVIYTVAPDGNELLVADNGYQSFSSGIGANNTTYYTIVDQSGTNWEVGLGTVGATGLTLTRTTVLSSSNGGSLVNFSVGVQNIWGDYPAGKAVYKDSIGTASLTRGNWKPLVRS